MREKFLYLYPNPITKKYLREPAGPSVKLFMGEVLRVEFNYDPLEGEQVVKLSLQSDQPKVYIHLINECILHEQSVGYHFSGNARRFDFDLIAGEDPVIGRTVVRGFGFTSIQGIPKGSINPNAAAIIVDLEFWRRVID